MFQTSQEKEHFEWTGLHFTTGGDVPPCVWVIDQKLASGHCYIHLASGDGTIKTELFDWVCYSFDYFSFTQPHLILPCPASMAINPLCGSIQGPQVGKVIHFYYKGYWVEPATLQHFYGAISPSCSSHSEPHSGHWEVAGFPWVKTCLC